MTQFEREVAALIEANGNVERLVESRELMRASLSPDMLVTTSLLCR